MRFRGVETTLRRVFRMDHSPRFFKQTHCAECPNELNGRVLWSDKEVTRRDYCSKVCMNAARMKYAAGMQSPWYVVAAIFFVIGITSAPRPSGAHEPYSGWTIPGQNKSCCNTTDCAPTRAKFERGNWWAFVNSKRIWIKVPDDRIVRYKTEDTDAHLCYGETFGEVFCFRPPPTGM